MQHFNLSYEKPKIKIRMNSNEIVQAYRLRYLRFLDFKNNF